MTGKKSILYLTLICFLLLGFSGLVLFFSFDEDVFRKIIGFNKTSWLNFHLFTAIITVLFIAYHVGSRWSWVEKYLIEYNKRKVSPGIKQRQYSNFSMMLFFTISLCSGFLSWIMSGECPICLEVHKISGLFFLVAFIFHFILHFKELVKPMNEDL